jgi:hypothetical protein
VVVLPGGWVVLVLEKGSVAGEVSDLGVGAAAGVFVLRMVGAANGPSSLEEPGDSSELGFGRWVPPNPASSAAMTAATTPKEASGVRNRARHVGGRACFGACLDGRVRWCFATWTREVGGTARGGVP